MNEPVFVARERELEQLGNILDQARSGQGQACFVAGGAGTGKTVLVAEFAHRALINFSDLHFLYGSCNAQTGISDPYLPFREMLVQLTGDVESKKDRGVISQENNIRLKKTLVQSIQILLEVSPDLIGAFIPGSRLIALLGKAVVEKAGLTKGLEKYASRKNRLKVSDATIDQNHIFEQYTNVLVALAEQHPLVLVLDDLQWADTATISLLFHLGRRIKDSRIMIIGIYRPAEVATGIDSGTAPDGRGRHPLESVLIEFKRYYGDIWIDLDQTTNNEGRQFVDAILDADPNRIGEDFRKALFQHTGGYAIFTVELIRDMKERGDLIQNDDGEWISAETLDWQTLPAKVEGVIEKRIKRLEKTWQDLLVIASVEGETFIAEVVARVHEQDERELVQLLSRELDKKHRLVITQNLERIGQQRISRFRFRHNLFQYYLYHSLDESDRSYLHEAVGNVLESLFEGHTDDVAVQLAWHFQEAGMVIKAVGYLEMAGDGSARVYAYTEAIASYRQALALINDFNVCQEHLTHIYSSLGRMLELNSQFDEALGTYKDMERAAQKQNNRQMELASYIAQVTLYSTPTPVHDPVKGPALGQETLALARELADPAAEAKTLWNLALGGMWSGRTHEGISYAEQAVFLARQLNLTELLAYSLNDLGMLYAAVLDVEKAIPALKEAGKIWRQLDNLPMVTDNLSMTGMALIASGDYESAIELTDEAFQISESHNNLWGQSYSRMMPCLAYWEFGNPDQALATASESIRLGKLAGFIASQVLAGGNKAAFLGNLGAIDQGLEVAQEAVDVAETQFPHFRCHPLGVLVQLHLMDGNQDKAEALIEQGRSDIYREAHPTWNMRINIAEVELALKQGDHEQAIKITDLWMPRLRENNLRLYSPAMLYLKSKAQVGMGQTQAALESLLEAQGIAEAIGAQASLWPILFAISKLETDPANAQQLHEQAQGIVKMIASHISSSDLRKSFMEQTNVRDLFE